MKAAYLIKTGPADHAFEIRETEKPQVKEGEVLIEVEAFGLNFADVMARLGIYPDAPPIPAILGYDVVGRIVEIGKGVTHLSIGDRVVALTRFGGYAQFAATDARAAVKIGDDVDPGVAVALATQCGTAVFMAEESVRLHEGDAVLVHAAAGGVGTALVQLARNRKCVIYGTAGSTQKLEYLRIQGVDHPINYRTSDFEEEVKRKSGEAGLDVVFDPVGGSSVKKGFRLLGKGGRMIVFGASSLSQAKNIFSKIRLLLQFGFYHPVGLMRNSKGLIGVNMLKIADERPHVLKRVLERTVSLYESGILQPTVGGAFSIDDLAKAHHLLETRQTTGKVVIKW